MHMFRSMLMILPTTLALASCTSINGGIRSFNVGDCAGAVRQWLPLAQRGDSGAQNNMGMVWEQGCQDWGEGFPVNYTEAYNWFMLAASNGLPLSMYNLGRSHELGFGVEQSSEKAVAWYTLAARHAEPYAQARLAALGQAVPAANLVVQQAPVAEGSWTEAFALAFLTGAAEGIQPISIDNQCLDTLSDASRG